MEPQTADAFLQHLDADAQVGHRVKSGSFAAQVGILVVMNLGHDLHQALRADRALRKGIEARFNGHDGQNQGGIKFDFVANIKAFGTSAPTEISCATEYFLLIHDATAAAAGIEFLVWRWRRW